jgi:hypothetical protein
LATNELSAATRQRTVLQFLFHQGIMLKNNITVVSHPPHSFLLPRLQTKLKDRHFDAVEVIEAESQAVPKPSQNAFQEV